MDEIIAVKNLTKDYGKGKGIFGFDFTVKKGEIFGLVGTNGSGKTTTIRNMMGFLKPDKGSISVKGLDSWSDAKDIKKLVGYVPGEIDFPNVGSGNAFLKIQADYLGIKDYRYMNRLIDLFKIDTSAPLKRMSKGMKQKTALVAAFMSEPEILILDEPSTGLDPMMRDTLIELILEQKKQGRTVFLSSHIFKELEDTCDRVAFIHNGKFISLVDRKEYDSNMKKQYRIGFQNRNDFEDFFNKDFRIVKDNPKYLHLSIVIGNDEINRLFETLSHYDMRYINYEPYTLEWYYTNIIRKGEN